VSNRQMPTVGRAKAAISHVYLPLTNFFRRNWGGRGYARGG